MTTPRLILLVTVIQLAGTLCGYLYCFYCVAFRWNAIRRKYGRLDLMFWVGYVLFLWNTVFYVLGVAVWVGSRSIAN